MQKNSFHAMNLPIANEPTTFQTYIKRKTSKFPFSSSVPRVTSNKKYSFCCWHLTTVSSNSYVSCVLGCPYEGHVEPSKVAEVRRSRTARPHSWVCPADGPLWCCSAGGQEVIPDGLLRDFLGGHHRGRDPGLHAEDAAKRDEGGACECARGPLPRHVRTSAGQHPHGPAGERLLTRFKEERSGSERAGAKAEKALCSELIVKVVMKLV